MKNDDLKELKNWLEGYLYYTETKIENMKRIVPDHKNIILFVGEVMMARKILTKIEKTLEEHNEPI